MFTRLCPSCRREIAQWSASPGFADAFQGGELRSRTEIRTGFTNDACEAATGTTVTVSREVGWLRHLSRRSEGSIASTAKREDVAMLKREIAPLSTGGQVTAPSGGLRSRHGRGHRVLARPRPRGARATLHAVPSGTTGVSAWILLSLAAVFSHDASSRDTEPAGTEPVQAHVRSMDSRAMFTGGMIPRLASQSRGRGDVDFVAGRLPFGIRSGYMLRDDLTAVGLTRTHISDDRDLPRCG